MLAMRVLCRHNIHTYMYTQMRLSAEAKALTSKPGLTLRCGELSTRVKLTRVEKSVIPL